MMNYRRVLWIANTARALVLLCAAPALVVGCGPTVYAETDPRVDEPAALVMISPVSPPHISFERTVNVDVVVGVDGSAQEVALSDRQPDESGAPNDLSVSEDWGSRLPALETEALRAAQEATYTAAQVDGHSVAQLLHVSVRFNEGHRIDQRPELLKFVPPVYPKELRDQGVKGVVLVEVKVGINGRVMDARAVSGPSELWQSAVTTALKCVFRPAMFDGEPVPVWTVMSVGYMLQ